MSLNQKSELPLIILGVAIWVLIILCIALVVCLYRQDSLRRPEKIALGLMPADTFLLAWPDLRIRNLAGCKHPANVYGDVLGVKDAWDEFLKESGSHPLGTGASRRGQTL